jgi:hypothetical protein
VDAPALYDAGGRYAGFDGAALVACTLGAIVYALAREGGGTLPALATAVLADQVLQGLKSRAAT